jgi:hypothetical protein
MWLNVNALLSPSILLQLFATQARETIITVNADEKAFHTFTNGTKKFFIRSEKVVEIKYSFDENNFDNNNQLTITSGGFLEQSGLYLVGKTIYFKSDKNTEIEILEWF